MTTYTWKAFHCELCKCKLQDCFEINGRQYRIFEVEKPVSNYMVVETSQINSSESDSEKQKQLHIISFENTSKVRFGRGHETEVRIVDISVSRLHAIIHKDELGRLYLEDNGSKFGTLAQVQAPMHLNEHFEYSFQAGRSVFHVNMQQEQSIFNFMKSSQPQSAPIFKDEHGKLISVKPSSSSDPDSQRAQLNRNYQIFRSYVGQFCSRGATDLIRPASEFRDELEECLCPEDESVCDENEDGVAPFNVQTFSPLKQRIQINSLFQESRKKPSCRMIDCNPSP